MCAAGSEKVRVGGGIKLDEDATYKLVYLTMPRANFVYQFFGLPRSDEPQGLHDVSVLHLPKSAATIKSNFHLPIAIPPPPGDT
jgi:hypothetical protein